MLLLKEAFKKNVAVLGLCCCVGFSLVAESGVTLVAVHRLLIVVTSLDAQHGLHPVVTAPRF